MTDERLLSPAEYYESELRGACIEKLSKRFEDLARESGVDAEENARTVELLDNEDEALSRLKKRKKLFNFLLVVLIAIIIVCAAVGCFLANNWTETRKEVIEAGGLALGAGLSVYLALLSFSKVKALKRSIREKEGDVDSLRKKAWGQMAPLLAELDGDDFCRIAEGCVPAIKIEPFISSGFMERLETMSRARRGLLDHVKFLESDSVTTVSALSGSVDGKLFLMSSNMRLRMGTKTYTGSISVPYTDYVTDSNGNTRNETRYETLVASVEKPFPYYDSFHDSVYFCDACPNLDFTRRPSKVSGKSGKSLERAVKKAAKKFEKIERKALKDDKSNFTALSNPEFEAMFNCVDRNNDVEFRMMYTSYAIKQFTELVKSPHGFGDGFDLEKRGCSTACILDAGKLGYSGGIRVGADKMASHSFVEIRNRYEEHGKLFFRNFFFGLAPLFMIPIYADSPDEDLERVTGARRSQAYSWIDAESLASARRESFRPVGTVTDVIIKCVRRKDLGHGTLFGMRASSFHAVDRVESVFVHGFHTSAYVPVHWVEYIPDSRDRKMFARYLGGPQGKADAAMESFMPGKEAFFKDGFMAVMVEDESEATAEDFRRMVERMASSVGKPGSESGGDRKATGPTGVRTLLENVVRQSGEGGDDGQSIG